MSVIPLTIFFSLLLAGLFIVLFAHEQRRRRFASAERDSLLPLADEQPRLAGARSPLTRLAATATHGAHDHDHADDQADHDHAHEHDDHAHHHAGDHACGCRTGLRPPCVGCLKRTGPASPANTVSK